MSTQNLVETTETLTLSRSRKKNDLGLIACSATVAAIVSLLITGFLFPVGNNLFHLPIVANLYDLPQFSNDTFIQSLRLYSSGVWILLKGADAVVPARPLFLTMLFFSRIVTFLGFFLLADLLGLRKIHERALFGALITVTFVLRGTSYAGGGGLFIDSFTHSELANGFILLAIFFSVTDKHLPTIVSVGATFFCNAFMGVWAAIIVTVIFFYTSVLAKPRVELPLKEIAVGGVLAALISAPVIQNILSNPETAQSLSFSYSDYLKYYYPNHFFIESTPLSERLALTLVSCVGALSLLLIQSKIAARRLVLALGSAAAIYLIGTIVPLFTYRPAIINLHFLRIGAIIELIALLSSCVITTTWFFSRDSRLKNVVGAIAIVFIGLPCENDARIAIILFGIFIIFLAIFSNPKLIERLEPRVAAASAGAQTTAIILLIASLSFLIGKKLTHPNRAESWQKEWADVANYAREHTDESAVFLTPHVNLKVFNNMTSEQLASQYSTAFEFISKRRVWVDFKRGAAVMWSPLYYFEWRKKIDAVKELSSHSDRIQYAEKNKIDFLIEACVPNTRPRVEFQTKNLCVFRVKNT